MRTQVAVRTVQAVRAKFLTLACVGAAAAVGILLTPSSSQVQAQASPRAAAVSCEWDVDIQSVPGPRGWTSYAHQVLQEVSQLTGIRMRIRDDSFPALRTPLDSEAAGQGRAKASRVSISWGTPATRGGSVLNAGQMGLTRWKSQDSGELKDAQVNLNLEYWHRDGEGGLRTEPETIPGAVSGKRVVSIALLLRHEIGHALGLPHSTDITRTMTTFPREYLGTESYDEATRQELSHMYAECLREGSSLTRP